MQNSGFERFDPSAWFIGLIDDPDVLIVMRDSGRMRKYKRYMRLYGKKRAYSDFESKSCDIVWIWNDEISAYRGWRMLPPSATSDEQFASCDTFVEAGSI